MGKIAVAPPKHVLEQNFQLPTPLKFGSPVFRVLTEMQNWCRPLEQMGKMAVAPIIRVLEQNFQLPTPLKFGCPGFTSVPGIFKIGVSHYMKLGNNGCSSPKMHPRAKLSITNLLKFGSPVF